MVDSFEPCIGASIITTSRLHQANEDASDMEVDYCGLLVQQSSIGDVFAQRLSTRRPQSIRTTTSTNLSNKTSNTSSKLSSKYVDPHADYFSSDGEEDRTGSKLVSSRIDHGCRVVVPVVYPPVQFNLPIGNRCFSQEPAEKTYNAIISLFETAGPSNRKWLHLEASSAAGSLLKSYIDIRNFFYHHAEQEHSLYPGLITQQRPISIFDIQRGQYPLNHQSFRKFIPEDSLQGMDALELFPQDLRRDLPTLPNEPEFTAIPAAITTVFYLTEIEEFVKQHLEELHNFVGKYSATLWEIWRFLFEKTNRKLSYPVLRQCLLKLNFYELWIPSRKDQSVDVMVSHFSTDGLVVKKMSLRSDASSKSKTKRSLADDDSIVSVINERKNSKRKSSKSGAGGMLSDDDNDGDSDGSKSSRGSRGSSRGGNRDTSNPYSCRCFEDIAELQKWGQGNRGGCLNNANYLLPCSKRNCLIPHRLVYSFTTTQSVPLASSQLHTPHHSSSSQFSFENTTQLDQKSDITDDICAALEDLWDETALTAYPEWPNITDVELHKKKNETL